MTSAIEFQVNIFVCPELHSIISGVPMYGSKVCLNRWSGNKLQQFRLSV